jgi:peroxiredoxin
MTRSSFLVLSLSLAPLACGGASTGGGHSATAADFTARDVHGNTFRLSDHLGKEVILLDFWATFCEPCKAEFPHFRALYERYKARGLVVVAIAMDGPETVADVPAFVKRFDITFPAVTDEDSRIASLFNPKKSMPLSVLIGLDGKPIAVREGYTPGDEKLVERDVESALASRGSP